MASLNKVMIIGNLTRDPEIRYTPKGMAVVDIGIAVNRRYRVENETREEVTFLDVTFWGKQAEVICQYMKKGRPLYVEGRLQMDSWDDKQTGQKRYRLKITGEEFQFIGSGGGGGGGGRGDSGYDSNPVSDDQGGYSSGRSSQDQQQRQPRNSSGGGGGGGDPFPPGLDDDEVPF